MLPRATTRIEHPRLLRCVLLNGHLLLYMIGGLAVGAASATTTIYVDFGHDLFTAEEESCILDKIREKFDFSAQGLDVGDNVVLTTDAPPPPPATPRRLVFDNANLNGTNKEWGKTTGNASQVFVKHVTEQFSNHFDTDAKKCNALAETGAHELGHQLGLGGGHNKSAPSTATVYADAQGTTRKRTPGDGTSVGGAPGLMANGESVTPMERANDNRQFAMAEKVRIANLLNREKGGQRVRPGPGRGGVHKNLQPIQGTRFDPFNPPPDQTEPYPASAEEQWVDMEVSLSGNADWDFGFVTEDGGFLPVIAAGETEGTLSFEPGTVVDFAIREVGLPDDARLAMSEIGVIKGVFGLVPSVESVDPVVTDDYWRGVVMDLDTDGESGTPGVIMTISTDETNAFDGFRILEPPWGPPQLPSTPHRPPSARRRYSLSRCSPVDARGPGRY